MRKFTFIYADGKRIIVKAKNILSARSKVKLFGLNYYTII